MVPHPWLWGCRPPTPSAGGLGSPPIKGVWEAGAPQNKAGGLGAAAPQGPLKGPIEPF